jgi:hypothetical protein
MPFDVSTAQQFLVLLGHGLQSMQVTNHPCQEQGRVFFHQVDIPVTVEIITAVAD